MERSVTFELGFFAGSPSKPSTQLNKPRMRHISDRHPKQLLDTLDALRRCQELCDVVIKAGSKTLFAHRVILAACSPYFRAMFTGEMAESRQMEITIQDVDESAM